MSESDVGTATSNHDSGCNLTDELTQQNSDDTMVSTTTTSESELSGTSTDTLTDVDSPLNAIISSDDDSDDCENSKEILEEPEENDLNSMLVDLNGKVDPGPCKEISREIVNTTKSSITVFEGFITDRWSSRGRSSGCEKTLGVLKQQLKYGGGFCEEMKRLDLSTPPHVRLDMDKVLSLLSYKTSTSAVRKVEKFVLPNIEVLESGDKVNKLLGDFCQVLGGPTTVTTIDELSICCDKISENFVAGDLKWIRKLYSQHQINRITLHVDDSSHVTKSAESTISDFKTFQSKLCKCRRKKRKRQGYHYDKLDFQRVKRPAPSDDLESESKRCCTKMDLDGRSKMTDEPDNTTKTDITVNCSLSLDDSILWTCWSTDLIHEREITGDGVVIAVIDSGINITHEAFSDRIIAVNDITCNGNIDVTNDHSGHGTMCTYIACGASFKSVDPRTEKSIRIPAGVAPKAKIVTYKVTGSAGQAHTDMVTKALHQCLEDKDLYGIDIILLPNGLKYQNFQQDSIIRQLEGVGVLIVTAPGNSGHRQYISYPAASGNTICVGAHDKYCNTTGYTTKGRELDFTAPGVGLVGASVAHPNAFTVGQGTSYSAASFAGLLALVIHFIRLTCSDKDLKKLRVQNVRPSLEEVLHDRVAMKRLLQRYSKHRTWMESDGYGHIDTIKLFSNGIDLVKNLYEDIFVHK